LYEGADHGLGGAASAVLGPNPATYLADWFKDRMVGKPTQTKHMKVDATGQVHESTFEEARKALSWYSFDAVLAHPRKPADPRPA
jgi:hypothetical protein